MLPLDISDVLDYRHEDLGTIEKIAAELTLLTSTAARLSRLPRNEEEPPTYYEWLMNPRKAELDTIIQKKRITKEQVQRILDKSLMQLGDLKGISPMTLSDWPRGMEILELKMREGGINEEDIEETKDHDNAAFTLLTKWNYRFGKLEANAMVEDLRLKVRHECRDVYNIYKNSPTPFGEEMLTTVRERLRQRQPEIAVRYQNKCFVEHLEGVAGMLTERCDVWWSKKFEVLHK